MEAERRKVLEMLSEGKIKVEEAERLLERLRSLRPEEEPGEEAPAGEERNVAAAAVCLPGKGAVPRWLRILVNGGDDKVNIRVPIALVRTGIMLSTMLPESACAKLSERGIDLQSLGKLGGGDLVKALRELDVNVCSRKGETVRIYCE
jgi:hypothetical protein